MPNFNLKNHINIFNKSNRNILIEQIDKKLTKQIFQRNIDIIDEDLLNPYFNMYIKIERLKKFDENIPKDFKKLPDADLILLISRNDQSIYDFFCFMASHKSDGNFYVFNSLLQEYIENQYQRIDHRIMKIIMENETYENLIKDYTGKFNFFLKIILKMNFAVNSPSNNEELDHLNNIIEILIELKLCDVNSIKKSNIYKLLCNTVLKPETFEKLIEAGFDGYKDELVYGGIISSLYDLKIYKKNYEYLFEYIKIMNKNLQ